MICGSKKMVIGNMENRVKIVYLIDILDGFHGGTENQLVKLINGLNRKKYLPHLICLNNSGWFRKNCLYFNSKTTGIDINNFRKLNTYINFLKLVRMLKRDKPDVVHTFFPTSNIVGVLAAKVASIKNIISSRRDYGEWINRRYLLGTKVANRFVQKIIVNSHSVKRLTVLEENVQEDKVEVIYNGIDLPRFEGIKGNSWIRSELNIPYGSKVVGIIANFRPMKRHDTFVKAAKEILQMRDDVEFILIGGQAQREEMEILGEYLNIKKHLHFMGVQRDIMPYLSIMDIGVNCSEKEGLSNAVMEYMAAGVPCVVSNAGGNPDLITHNVNGYTFELGDYNSLASLILNLLDDQKTKEKFVRNSREKIEKEMSLEAMISKYESLYERNMQN